MRCVLCFVSQSGVLLSVSNGFISVLRVFSVVSVAGMADKT